MAELEQHLRNLKSPNLHTRKNAVLALADMQDERIVPALSKALDIPCWYYLHGLRKFIKYLIADSRAKSDSVIYNYQFGICIKRYRAVIVASLVARGDARAVKALGKLLRISYTWNSKYIVEAIGTFDSEQAWTVLCDALKMKFVVKEAAIVLHKRDKIRAIEPLIQAFAMRQYQNPRQGDILSTQQIIAFTQATLINLLVDSGEPAVTSLINALQNKRWLVRDGAAKTLGQIGDKRAIEPLWEARKNTAYAPIAVARLDYEKAVDELIHQVETVAPYTEEAAQVLGEHKEEKAVAVLSAKAKDFISKRYNPEFGMYSRSYPSYFESYIQALEAIGTPEALAVAADWHEKFG